MSFAVQLGVWSHFWSGRSSSSYLSTVLLVMRWSLISQSVITASLRSVILTTVSPTATFASLKLTLSPLKITEVVRKTFRGMRPSLATVEVLYLALRWSIHILSTRLSTYQSSHCKAWLPLILEVTSATPWIVQNLNLWRLAMRFTQSWMD